MPQLIPGLGVRGVFTLKPPFDAKMLPNTAYQVVAVRQLADIVAAGGDPRAMYYTPVGLDQAAFEADISAGAVIVSLQASSGVWLYVPSTYILAMPNQGGIPYTVLALACSLGAVANSLDLSYVKDQVKQTVVNNLGLDPTKVEVHEVALSTSTQLTLTEHTALEAARLARKTESTTTLAQLLQRTSERDALAQRVQELETLVSDAISKGYTGTSAAPAPPP